MDLPLELKNAMEAMLAGRSSDELRKIAKQMTDRYKNESGRGRVLVSSELETQVYAAVRMPATYGAVCDALAYTMECCEAEIETVMDVGAGSGTGAWAVDARIQPKQILCLEREITMRETGKRLMEEDPDLQARTKWVAFDLTKDEFGSTACVDKDVAKAPDQEDTTQAGGTMVPASADLVLSSYVLNEMPEDVRATVIRKLWAATKGVLTIVEPGTKEGFAVIAQAREILLDEGTGAHLIAPCPHVEKCRLKEDDWCHFTCRVMRSRLHKMLKDADVPYEDEKYSYISFARQEGKRAPARVLRHPYITKGTIDLELCTQNENTKVTIRKKQAAFKEARKAKMGDAFYGEWQ